MVGFCNFAKFQPEKVISNIFCKCLDLHPLLSDVS